MSTNYKVQSIYDSEFQNITSSQDIWKDVLELVGRIYRYEFDNIVMIYAQRPNSSLVADFDTWKKVGRYVKRGSKGIAIFPSRALTPYCRYVFDISDTGGSDVRLTWNLEGDTLKEYLDYLVHNGQIEQYESDDRDTLKNSLKLFTRTNVWAIIKEDFEDRYSELMQLSGSRIMELNEKRESAPDSYEAIGNLLYQSVMYVVGTRCGFDLSVQEQDFSQIVNIKDEEVAYRLGSLVCDISCSVLRQISINLSSINRQKNMEYERRMSNGNDLSRDGRNIVSRHRDATKPGTRTEEIRQIRKDGNEVPSGESEEQVQLTLPIREVSSEDAGSRRGSEHSARHSDGGLPAEAQTTQSVINNGDVEAQGAGKDASGGDRTSPGSADIPLEVTNNDNDDELNKELNELNSFGKSQEAGQYEQASFFDSSITSNNNKSNFTFISPKKEKDVNNERRQ